MRTTQATSRTERPQRILLVEDDEDIRTSTAELVRSIGHHVEAVGDPAAALSALESGPIDVLLADIDLAGHSGVELARQAVGRWPGLQVVFVSGYAQTPAEPAAAGLRNALYLQKPYDLAMLERTLEAAARRRGT